MTQLPTIAFAARMNALAAAAVVTLAMLSGIDAMATVDGSAPQMAQSIASKTA